MTCRHCDYLASEVMRLREDRNEWRRMYIELMALLSYGVRPLPRFEPRNLTGTVRAPGQIAQFGGG